MITYNILGKSVQMKASWNQNRLANFEGVCKIFANSVDQSQGLKTSTVRQLKLTSIAIGGQIDICGIDTCVDYFNTNLVVIWLAQRLLNHFGGRRKVRHLLNNLNSFIRRHLLVLFWSTLTSKFLLENVW